MPDGGNAVRLVVFWRLRYLLLRLGKGRWDYRGQEGDGVVAEAAETAEGSGNLPDVFAWVGTLGEWVSRVWCSMPLFSSLNRAGSAGSDRF